MEEDLENHLEEGEVGMKKRKKKKREMEEGPGRPHQVLLGSRSWLIMGTMMMMIMIIMMIMGDLTRFFLDFSGSALVLLHLSGCSRSRWL